MAKWVYRFTLDAKADLIDIRAYGIKNWGEEKSKAYLSGLRQVIQQLAEFPAMGQFRADVAEKVFSFPYVSHMIYCTLHHQQLVVFAVIHQSRAPLLHLEPRKKS